ncbi:MAG: phosphoadenosine phosphosulfate reductase family protein [Maricaulis sp.]|nr:phosphoadenosine phosphosulfate reductase family protein [Maricaulis sp.]MBO6728432.1 phosphoadenosine phosphosulfate reductase family protein [Maricaulis sp.]MBO6848423.1 phosphoadenosine phosphosulfate reductase family protein [Maricaulis sp.]MBO6878205.1 phosphoadenosine phosphosulfate reductase family protein [Maricaulis sp.]
MVEQITDTIRAYAPRFGPERGERKTELTPHLAVLEVEAIHIMSEVAADFERPVMLYSTGEYSTMMLRLAMKAFWPAKPLFSFLHIDCLWDFGQWAGSAIRSSRSCRMWADSIRATSHATFQ